MVVPWKYRILMRTSVTQKSSLDLLSEAPQDQLMCICSVNMKGKMTTQMLSRLTQDKVLIIQN
ncbi:hypothetical protein RHMOL_Rhmol07G0043800 [Rhododendron molle]|uniref:Uncharacterized protein n=1 Tax=Rhododendron molle TaxID=49168 RepID=A0ACC0MYA4_RHOML|nr:hypothetical protein RHMOL_Rhmol07G0043800 [Rhododendron molle]